MTGVAQHGDNACPPFISLQMQLPIKLASTFLLFPANMLLLAALGLLLRHRWRRAIWLSWCALALLWLFSTRAGALLLLAPLEAQSPAIADVGNLPSTAQAIVVLGASRQSQAPEYNHQYVPNYLALARLRYAAKLHRDTRLPVLITGGKTNDATESEAEVMARSLRDDFGVTARWLENEAMDTAQNASLSAILLRQAGIQRIMLVTDAMHMPRALASFQKTGLEITAAPTVFFSHERLVPYDYVPSGEGLRRSNYALHEWIGLLWYKLR
ncbi:YdcF family protein [Herbaspirillum sp. CF444]|uniref:YdcF family protein n=1 Tax=Herbaspirillum sp. CF444 TaxID=1144319 RepID=UPI001ED93381|nr:YdcF family protein [Herbaspirillum sp. CF444]